MLALVKIFEKIDKIRANVYNYGEFEKRRLTVYEQFKDKIKTDIFIDCRISAYYYNEWDRILLYFKGK